MSGPYPHGLFSWIDLLTTDQQAAKAWYEEMFGWTGDDQPTGPGSVYTMFSHDGQVVAGAGEMDAETKAAGMPPVWNSYVTVDDVDAIATQASELGGSVMLPPMDVMDAGRMAIIGDPTGAAVSVWQAENHHGAEKFNDPVSLTWNELNTRDPESATEFYSRLFGWNIDEVDMPAGPYITGSVGDRMNSGIMVMGDDVPAGVPSHWMVYLAVEDCDATVAKAQATGGSLVWGPTEAAGVGRMAGIADPQGAMFAVMGPETEQ